MVYMSEKTVYILPTDVLHMYWVCPTDVLPMSYPRPTHVLPMSYPCPAHVLPIVLAQLLSPLTSPSQVRLHFGSARFISARVHVTSTDLRNNSANLEYFIWKPTTALTAASPCSLTTSGVDTVTTVLFNVSRSPKGHGGSRMLNI